MVHANRGEVHPMNYYNDNSPEACAWVEGLVSAGLVPPGDVDCRSITDIKPDELKKYTQCHLFCQHSFTSTWFTFN